jgi:hypothetical protein
MEENPYNYFIKDTWKEEASQTFLHVKIQCNKLRTESFENNIGSETGRNIKCNSTSSRDNINIQ